MEQSVFSISKTASIKTKHSKRPMIDYIKIIARNKAIVGKPTTDSASACYECLDKIDVYDLARATVEKIENELAEYLAQSNTADSKSRSAKQFEWATGRNRR